MALCSAFVLLSEVSQLHVLSGVALVATVTKTSAVVVVLLQIREVPLG